MHRWFLTLAAAAAIGLAGTAPGLGQTATPKAAPADRSTVDAATKKATNKVKRKTRRRYRYGRVYLTAYAKSGRQAKAGSFGTRLRLYLEATKARKTRKGKRRAGRTEAVRFCGKEYFTTKRGTRWIDAHKKAGHVLVVRKHVARKKFEALCGTPPKRVKRRAVKRKKPTTKADKKS